MVFVLVGGLTVSPRPAHAQWITADPGAYVRMALSHVTDIAKLAFANSSFLKEYVLDGAAWMLAKSVVREMTSDMINDVATGHLYPNGRSGPGFVTNLENYSIQVGDRAEQKSYRYIKNNVQPKVTNYAKHVAHSIGNNIKTAYYNRTAETGYWSTHKETLSGLINKNPDASVASTTSFLAGNFTEGGWSGFNAIDANVNNNPYYVYQEANATVKTKVVKAKTNKKTELNWGQGLLSKTQCTKATKTTKAGCSIQTPGTIIKTQLNKGLGSGISSLVAADEVDEIIGSLAQGLVSKVVGGKLGGLTGIAKSAGGGAASYLNKYVHEPPPKAVLTNTARSMENQIARQEKNTRGFIKNEQIILAAVGKARSALLQLINYTPPSILDANECIATLNGDVSAAQSALHGVQSTYSQTQTTINKAQKGLSKLKQIDAQTKTLARQTKTSKLSTLQQITGEFQNLTSYNGGLPSAQAITNAQTESTASTYGVTTNGNSQVSSSGTAGLTVTGGTIIDQMNLLTQKASTALGTIQSCFSSYAFGS